MQHMIDVVRTKRDFEFHSKYPLKFETVEIKILLNLKIYFWSSLNSSNFELRNLSFN